ncbi:MAG: guanylate kinase [Ruminococcaceae bacterium]|nr:guanylate kinase [Oscillospiraceae bacterium]
MGNEQTRGLLIVLSGPSGTGKGTVVRALLDKRADTVLSVSATTRAPREGEIDGVHYHFIDQKTFLRLIEENAFLEYAEYNGNFYGTPKAAAEAQLRAGRNVVLEIEVQGAGQVMNSGADILSIFLAVPSMEELERRLRGRGTEDEATIRSRLALAKEEMKQAFRYQYVVMNDVVEDAVMRIETIIKTENMRYPRMEKTIMEVIESC